MKYGVLDAILTLASLIYILFVTTIVESIKALISFSKRLTLFTVTKTAQGISGAAIGTKDGLYSATNKISDMKSLGWKNGNNDHNGHNGHGHNRDNGIATEENSTIQSFYNRFLSELAIVIELAFRGFLLGVGIVVIKDLLLYETRDKRAAFDDGAAVGVGMACIFVGASYFLSSSR